MSIIVLLLDWLKYAYHLWSRRGVAQMPIMSIRCLYVCARKNGTYTIATLSLENFISNWPNIFLKWTLSTSLQEKPETKYVGRIFPTACIYYFDPAPSHTLSIQSSQVIEERRLKLQDYLRQVIELCSSTGISPKSKGKGSSPTLTVTPHPVLQADINKATLINLFPFFR